MPGSRPVALLLSAGQAGDNPAPGAAAGCSRPSRPPARAPAGRQGLAAAAVPLLTVVLASRRGQLSLATGVLAFVVAVIAAAMVGGLVPAALPAGRGPWQPPARPRGCLAPVPVLA